MRAYLLLATSLCGLTACTTHETTTTRTTTTSTPIESTVSSETRTEAIGPALPLPHSSEPMLVGPAQPAAPPSDTTMQITTPPAPSDVVVNTVNYGCEDGSQLTVAFNDTARTVTVRNSSAGDLTLPEKHTNDATFNYSDGVHAWHGKHETATWTANDSSVSCAIIP